MDRVFLLIPKQESIEEHWLDPETELFQVGFPPLKLNGQYDILAVNWEPLYCIALFKAVEDISIIQVNCKFFLDIQTEDDSFRLEYSGDRIRYLDVRYCKNIEPCMDIILKFYKTNAVFRSLLISREIDAYGINKGVHRALFNTLCHTDSGVIVTDLFKNGYFIPDSILEKL